MKKKSILGSLYFQVIVAITAGITLGHVLPEVGVQMKPFGDGFIKLIKMVIAPIIFGTVVVGIARIGDMKKLGRVGLKALLYFEAVTTLALIIGLVVVDLVQPGKGMHIDPASLDMKAVASYAASAKNLSTVDFILNIIPSSVVNAFAQGEILQVLLFSCLFGSALAKLGPRAKNVLDWIDDFTHGLFVVINYIMRLAPLGAFGAMGFTIGKYGLHTLFNLGWLMACVYITCFVFIFCVLGSISWFFCKINIWKFIKYISEEFLIVLGTSSSESVLPRMLIKMERAGAAKPVVGLVIPTGYTFNLDGTCIYLTMAAIFIAQACDVDLTLAEKLTVLLVLLLTSKGAAAVTGGGFITLAATLSTIDTIPVAGLALLLGVDRFMSEARALTNLIGNGIATLVVAHWENSLDNEQLRKALNGELKSLDQEEEERKALAAATVVAKANAPA